MVIIKLITNKSIVNDTYCWNLIKYMKYDKDCNIRNDFRYLNAYGVNLNDEDNMNMLKKCYWSIIDIKEFFNRKSCKSLIHYVVSFDKNHVNGIDEAIIKADLIAKYFILKKRQCVYAIHEVEDDKDRNGNFHVHYMINPVSYKNGTLLGHGKEDICDFIKYIKMTLCLNDNEITNIENNDNNENKKASDKIPRMTREQYEDALNYIMGYCDDNEQESAIARLNHVMSYHNNEYDEELEVIM